VFARARKADQSVNFGGGEISVILAGSLTTGSLL